MISYDTFLSPLGDLFILEEDNYLIGLNFNKSKNSFLNGVIKKETTLTKKVKIWLDAYFQKERKETDFLIKLEGSAFYQLVMNYIYQIPFGETRTYKQVGDYIKSITKKNVSYRSIGQALKKNKILLIYPCHRIISSNGSIGGFNAGVDKKKWLLSFEK